MNGKIFFFVMLLFCLPSGLAAELSIDPFAGNAQNLTFEDSFIHLSLIDKQNVFYIPFDRYDQQEFADFSGNDLDGVGGSGLSLTEGIRGKSISFSGESGGTVTVPHSSLLSINKSNGNYSMSFWMRVYGDSAGQQQFVLSKGFPSEYLVNIFTDNRPYFYYYLGGDIVSMLVNNPWDIRDNNWRHYTYTLGTNSSNYTATLYVNGQPVSSRSNIGFLPASLGSLLIGSHPGTYPFKGGFDEIMFFNKTLTHEEVNSLYNNQTSIFESRGELIFSNLNLSSKGRGSPLIDLYLNSSSLSSFANVKVQVGSPSLGSYLYSPEEELIDGHLNSLEVNNLGNVSLKVILYSDALQSPFIEETQINIEGYFGIPDLKAPILNVSPLSSVYSEEDFPITLNAFINEPGLIKYSLDGGASNYTMETQDSMHFIREIVSPFPDGNYGITFFASDYAGNSVASKKIFFDIEASSALQLVPPTFPDGFELSSQVTSLFTIPINVTSTLEDVDFTTFTFLDSRNIVESTTFSGFNSFITIPDLSYGNYKYTIALNSSSGGYFSSGEYDLVIERPLNFSIPQTTSLFMNKLSNKQVGSFMALGDSIEYRPSTWTYHFRDRLEEQFGNAGDGYFALGLFASSSSNVTETYLHDGLSFSTQGPCIVHSLVSGPRDLNGTRSIDGIYTKIGCSSSLTQTFYGTNVSVFYVKEPGAGIVNVTSNGIFIGSFNANHSETRIGVFNFTVPSGSAGSLSNVKLQLASASSGNPKWTQINAIQTLSSTGVVYNRMSRGGVGVVDYNKALPTIVEDTLSVVKPDLMILKLDGDESGTFANYQSNVTAFISRVKAGAPNAEIILLSYHNTSSTFVPEMEYLIDSALQEDYGFINFYDLLSHEQLLDGGYLVDSVHFSEDGGSYYGNYTYHTIVSQYVPIPEPRKSISPHTQPGQIINSSLLSDFI